MRRFDPRGVPSSWEQGSRVRAVDVELWLTIRHRLHASEAARLGPRPSTPPEPITLLSLCWCERETVTVPVRDVRLALTRPCHRRGCRARHARELWDIGRLL